MESVPAPTGLAAMLHNKCLPFSKISLLPDRKSFLNAEEVAITNKNISNGFNLSFMPTYVQEANLQPPGQKYGKGEYKIILFGVLQDGRRATVAIGGIYPAFEIEIPAGVEADRWAHKLYEELQLKIDDRTEKPKFEPRSFEIVTGRPFRYTPSPVKFMRVYFNKYNQRNDAVRYIQDKKLSTTNDDREYYRVMCRTLRKTLGTWCVLEKFTRSTYTRIKGEVFNVQIGNFKPKEWAAGAVPEKDKTWMCYWDSETWSPTGALPEPHNKDDEIIMISVVFFQCYSTTPLLQVCIVKQVHPGMIPLPHPEFLTIYAETEANMFRAFATLIQKLRPEFMGGFNSTDYDFPWLVVRASATPGLLAEIATNMESTIPYEKYKDHNIFDAKWYSESRKKLSRVVAASDKAIMINNTNTLFKHRAIKIDAQTNVDEFYLQIAGQVDIDVRTLFYKLHPQAEKTSLKHFLEINGIKGKKEMPIDRIMDIYKQMKTSPEAAEALLDQYREIAVYCVYDSIRCHELIQKRNCILDMREFAALVYVSVEDIYQRANGMKIRNLLFSEAWQRNVYSTDLSNYTTKNAGKYLGAYVVEPRKTGLIGPKLSIDERCRKYLMSLTAEQLIALYRDRIGAKLGIKTVDIPIANLRKLYKPAAEDSIISREFAKIIGPILGGAPHEPWSNLENIEKYKEFAEMSEHDMQYWRSMINQHGATLSKARLEELQDKIDRSVTDIQNGQ